jgi:hypothetical protein
LERKEYKEDGLSNLKMSSPSEWIMAAIAAVLIILMALFVRHVVNFDERAFDSCMDIRDHIGEVCQQDIRGLQAAYRDCVQAREALSSAGLQSHPTGNASSRS